MSVCSDPVAPAAAGPRWTDEQLRAIERRTGDLLLDAAAGSGKTSVLVERFVRSVLEDGIEVAAMLTITFTEKAAAELRDRIRARLHGLGASEAARQTEGAFISTIHGFCARVLRANALAAGLDPRFVVLDRYETEPLVAAAFEDALQELAERKGREAVELVAAYGAWPLRSAVVSVYGRLRSAGQIAPRLPPCPPLPDAAAAGTELARAAEAVVAELRAVDSPGARVLEALDRLARCPDILAAPDLWPGDLDALRLPRNGAALSTDACVAYTEGLGRLREAVAARAAAPVRDLLDVLLHGFGRHYERRKRGVSGLDFEDLELTTRRLLGQDAELRERYAQRFARIMVDEFQDTNRVQLELIESIARGNLFTVGDAQQSIYGFRHAEVELFERRGERLEAVGARETLQTNFRSRPEILEALNQAFAAELGERFKPLRAGRADDGAAPAGDAPAADAPAGEAPAGEAPAVELLLVDKAADWENDGVASPWRVAEARLLADHLAGIVSGGRAPGDVVVLLRATTDMRIYERALEERGLPTYVIGGRGYWSHPQVVDLVCYLRALTNPRDEEALYSVLASPLVRVSLDGLVLLAAAARAAERDPWTLVRRGGAALDGLAASDREAVEMFAGWFASERERAPRAGAEELIDAALARSGYDVAMLAMPGGRRRMANVRKLMRLAREHEDAHGPGLPGFLAFVADRQAGRAPDARESEAPVEGEGLDAIRLMTIHRAKGLEFEVVAVADLGRSVAPGSELVRVTADGRLGLRLARAGRAGREPAFDYKALGDRQREAQESEERRLFYVSMTRARERLVLSGALKFDGFAGEGGPTGGGPAAWIAPAFVPELGRVLADGGGEVRHGTARVGVRVGRPDDPCQATADGGPAGGGASTPGGLRSPSPAGPADPPPPPLPADPPRPPLPAVPAVPAPPRIPPVATLSYSSLHEYARCGYRFYAERVLGLPPAPEAAGTGEPVPPDVLPGVRSAADRGVLLHGLLERLDFRRPIVPGTDAVLAAARRAGLRPPPGPAEADELAAMVRAFGAGELCARLGRARDVRREQRFAFAAGDVLVVGTFDVLAREPGERMLVVDYKSDRLAGASPAHVAGEAYGVQRLVYALAALRAGAQAVEIAHCFLERPNEPVTAAFTGADAPGLEAQLSRLVAGVTDRVFDVAPAPHRRLCSGCPAEGGLCSWPASQTRRESPDQLF